MAAVAFDTLAFVKRMQSAGMEQRQAEAFAEALSTVALDQVATKSDLKELEHKIVIRVAGIVAAIGTVMTAILGALISLHR